MTTYLICISRDLISCDLIRIYVEGNFKGFTAGGCLCLRINIPRQLGTSRNIPNGVPMYESPENIRFDWIATPKRQTFDRLCLLSCYQLINTVEEKTEHVV